MRCTEDQKLVERIIKEQIPLTVCPLSNIKLCVFDKMEDHNLKKMLDQGIRVTINSDDPAYFGGYINQNFISVQQALNLSENEIIEIAKNGFRSSFLPQQSINSHIESIEEFSRQVNKSA